MRMHSLFRNTIAVGAALAFWLTAAHALPPVGKEIKLDPKIKATADQNQIKHGMRVVVTLKDKSRVLGTVVWADPADDSLLVRERPGATPRKLQGKDIDGVDRIRLTSASGAALPDEPEIFQISEINGSLRTVRYFAPTLSQGERSQLSDLESAENQAARNQYLLSQLLSTIKQEVEMLRDQRAMLAQQRDMMATYATQMAWLTSFSPYLPTEEAGGLSPGFFSQGFLYPGYFAPYSGSGPGNRGDAGTAAAIDSMIAKQSTVEANLANANRALAVARSHGLYDGGDLVAVTVPAQPVVAPAADKGR